MTMKIRCRTVFDITATGVKNHFNRARLPFRDESGSMIADEVQWHRSRNKQRNWETLNQIISLRTLPMDISIPIVQQQDSGPMWEFEFGIDQPGALDISGDPLGALIQDSKGVPMHTGLDEMGHLPGYLVTDGHEANIFFNVVENKYS